MGKNRKEFNLSNPSEFCGDGSCGCGCDEFMENKPILSKQELQRIRSLLNKDSQEVNENLTWKKGIDNQVKAGVELCIECLTLLTIPGGRSLNPTFRYFWIHLKADRAP